jgi:hypothetical protein
MVRVLKTFLASLRAAGLYGKALKSQDKGDSRGALEASRKALAILAAPSIIREKPWTATMIGLATMMVEYHAGELGEQGASPKDLTDSLAFFRFLGGKPGQNDPAANDKIVYLEARLKHLHQETNPG